MNTIKVFIVDDENRSVRILSSLIAEYCPDLEITGSANTAKDAFRKIIKLPIDVLFLDIEMPMETGFDLLEKLRPCKFEVIFLTAHAQYAIKAFKYEAFDYIVKPVGIEALVKSVDRLRIKLKEKNKTLAEGQHEQIKIPAAALPVKIALPTLNGLVFISPAHITRLGAKGSYTVITLNDKKEIIVSKPLKDVEGRLSPDIFLRIHDSSTVNINYVKSYTKGRGGYVEMEDGTILNVSVRKKDGFISKFGL
jgi:two-component system, LytTR family, response regulator